MTARIPAQDKNYRPDIDGLRAIAVMAVVLFHLELSPFAGGYIGVDIFFVISGFLITRILCREIDEGRFSIIRFYERRMRRIAPALFAVILASLIAGYFIFMPKELVDLGRSVRYTLLMGANLYWWKSLNYFSAPPDTKPMLHMWSLGVEEQFYLFLPIILLFIAVKFPRWRVHILWGMLCVSLALSLFYILKNPPLVFFWLPFRAWELLAGSIIVFLPLSNRFSPRFNGLISIIGLFLILAPIFYLQKYALFPGLNAIPPVLGSALLIWVGTGYQGNIARILSFKPIVYIGLISYSLYLWHWPIIVYARYCFVDELTVWHVLILAVIIFVVSILSYHFIERPFRNRNFISPKGIFYFTIVGCAILFAGAFLFDKTKGLPNRLSKDVQNIIALEKDMGTFSKQCPSYDVLVKTDFNGACYLGTLNKKPNILLWGDSTAAAVAKGFDSFLQRYDQTGVLMSEPSCPVIPGLGSWWKETEKQCARLQRNAFKHIDDWGINVVVLHGRWSAFETEQKRFLWSQLDNNQDFKQTIKLAFDDLIKELKKRNIKIVIIEETPIYDKSVPLMMARLKLVQKTHEVTMPLIEANEQAQFFSDILAPYKNDKDILILNPNDILCNRDSCFAEKDGKPFYWDNLHMNDYGAEMLVPLYEPIVKFLNWQK